MTEVMVIGAGAAGFSAAMELADRGYTVHLFDEKTLGAGSSGRTPGRMGHGFHYVDAVTAKLYLRASIQVQRKYPGNLIGQELSWDHPLRHGRYFITKNSDHPKETILATYKEIQEEYQRLILEDPENEVFGPPDQFFRILKSEEYEHQVNPSIVDVGIETAEHLFRWSLFAENVKTKIISTYPNIILHENTEIVDITREESSSRFTLHTKNLNHPESKVLFHTDYLVNSTWQNIEYLNDKIGLPMIPQSRTNRLKTLLIVKLPESLLNCNSVFFCMGKHCMMSNMGDGTAMLTFAEVTNMEATDQIKMSKKAQRLLNDGATKEEKNAIAEQMIQGISKYIPDLINATILDVKFGVVQTEGHLTLEDLSNPQSSVHQRRSYGIREEQIGVVSNPCRKLFYFANNGIIVADLIDNQVKATKVIQECFETIKNRVQANGFSLSADMEKTVRRCLETHESSILLTSDVENIIAPIIKTIQNKPEVTEKIRNFGFFNGEILSTSTSSSNIGENKP
jgi:hypothetical protein